MALPSSISILATQVNRTTRSGEVLGPDQRVSPMDAIRSITINAAHQYFEEDSKGSIEPGKLADLVILEADPRDDIRNTNAIDMVMKNGELFDADTLNQIWPEKKPLPPLWWWDEQP